MNAPAYRRLLLATDGSLPALAATLHAIELARESGAELHALHVTTPESPVQVEFADENLDLLHTRPVDGLEAARYLATDADVRIHLHEAHGPIVDSILQTAQRIGADAIVLGETGTRPFRQIGPGSVAEAVQRHSAEVPAILVPGRTEEVVPVVKEIITRDPAALPGGASADPDVDWAEAARHPAFRDLVSAKARFLIPVLALSLMFYLTMTVLADFAPGFMARKVVGPLNVGYLLIFVTYVMAWVVGLIYVRVANRSFDPKAASASAALHKRKENA